MDYNLQEKPVFSVTPLLDTVSEQSVDLDFTLPDYCADIEKILKCTLEPKIYSRTVSGGQLVTEGATVVRVLYCDSDKKQLRCCEQTVPFSLPFSLSETPEHYCVLASAVPEYASCRAVSARRVTVHGAFSMRISIMQRRQQSVCCPDDSGELQLRELELSTSQAVAVAGETFSVTEEISLSNKPPVRTIVRSELICAMTDCKQMQGKLTVKGEMTLRMLYISDAADGETEQLIYIFPFSQTIEDADCPDDCAADVRLSVQSYDISLKSDLVSDNPVAVLDAKVSLCAVCYSDTPVRCITDAYSTIYPVELRHENITFTTAVSPLNVTASERVTLDIGVPVAKITDIFCEGCNVSAQLSEGKVIFTGKAKLCVLAEDGDNHLICVERSAEIVHEHPVEAVFSEVRHACCEVNSVSFRISEMSELELRLDIMLSALLVNTTSVSVINAVTADSDTPFMRESCALTLYYADGGEQIWDIAKRYCTCLSTLCSENSLSGDSLSSPCMLLIPRV